LVLAAVFLPLSLQAQVTQLQVTGLKQFYSTPYLLDFTFSVRDQSNHAVILDASMFSVVCKEDSQSISASETGYRLLSGDNKQLKGFLVLDYTLSMTDPIRNPDLNGNFIADSVEAMEAGAKSLVGGMHDDVQVGLFEFHRADAGFPPQRIASLTVDKAYLTNQIAKIYEQVVWSSGSTRCWDALYLALSEFGASNPADDQRFVMFLSDGRDESSSHTVSDVISLAQARGVKVYCIGFGQELAPANLQLITTQTGGQYYPAGSVAEMSLRFQQIMIDLGGQYVLRWATLKRTGSFVPSFELTYSGIKASATAGRCYPASYQGNELEGHLLFDASLSASNQAMLVLRMDYVPRGVTRIRLDFASVHPFTVERVPYAEGGVCPTNWSFVTYQTNGVGYFEFSSPAPANPFSALPFATLGKLVKFQMQGVTNLADCFYDLAVNNAIYPQPGGPSLVVVNAGTVVAPLTELPHGTPVWWLNQFGLTTGLVLAELSDLDGDGMPTWMEYQAGTNPTNSQSALRVQKPVAGTGGWQVAFATESNRIYRVETADELSQWQTFQDGILGNGQTKNVIDPTVRTQRFYRVAVTGVSNPPPANVILYTGQAPGSGIDIVDVHDPTKPTKIKTLNTPEGSTAISVEGTRAYIALNYSGFGVYDISNPRSPVEIATKAIGGHFAYDLVVRNQYLFVANGAAGLAVFDVINPSAPSEIARVASHDGEGGANSVCLRGNYAYVSDARGGLLVVDISSPANAREVGRLPVSSGSNPWYHTVSLLGNTMVCVTRGTDGVFEVVDVSNPASPVRKATVNGRNMHYVRVVGSYAFVAGWNNGGMQIIDLRNPDQPAIVGDYSTSGEANAVFVAGNFAYVSVHNSGVNILDISNPASPKLVGKYASPTSHSSMHLFSY
jgi:hypothetical protein